MWHLRTSGNFLYTYLVTLLNILHEHCDNLITVVSLGPFVIATQPVFTSTSQHDTSQTEHAMAPVFAAPLHEEMETLRADGAASPPMFIQSFESKEETLPFQLSVTEQPISSSSVTDVVEVTPLDSETQSSVVTEEVQEQLVELEIKAELKWAKS